MNEAAKSYASDALERGFQTITSVILGKKLAGYLDYEKWAFENVSTGEYGKSIMSGELIYLPPFDFYQEIKHNIVTIEEAYDLLGKKQLSAQELEQLSFSNAKKLLQKLTTTTPNTLYGESSNMLNCSFYYHSHFCYKGVALNQSKYCYYTFWPRQSEYMIGCYYTFSSSFCIKCYNSESLTRCFELSDCNNCSDCIFCHNCENLSNCMFCFNVKGKRNAIANIELSPDVYRKIKTIILGQIADELEKNKTLRLNIFNIGCTGK